LHAIRINGLLSVRAVRRRVLEGFCSRCSGSQLDHQLSGDSWLALMSLLHFTLIAVPASKEALRPLG